MENVIIGLLIGVVLFLLLREGNLWYWRVNDAVDAIHETNRLLRLIAEETDPEPTPEREPEPTGPTSWADRPIRRKQIW